MIPVGLFLSGKRARPQVLDPGSRGGAGKHERFGQTLRSENAQESARIKP